MISKSFVFNASQTYVRVFVCWMLSALSMRLSTSQTVIQRLSTFRQGNVTYRRPMRKTNCEIRTKNHNNNDFKSEIGSMSLRCGSAFLTRLRSLPQIRKCYYSSQHILQLNRRQNISSTQFTYRLFCNPASKGEVRISFMFFNIL